MQKNVYVFKKKKDHAISKFPGGGAFTQFSKVRGPDPARRPPPPCAIGWWGQGQRKLCLVKALPRKSPLSIIGTKFINKNKKSIARSQYNKKNPKRKS